MNDNILDDDFLYENQYDWTKVKDSDIVEIKTFAFEHEAQFAKTLLDAEQIPNFLKNANMASIYSGMSIGLGGVGLMVLRQDAQKVIEVLAKEDNPIEIDSEMLDESVYLDMELEAAEQEEAIEKPPFDMGKMIIFISIIIMLSYLG
ncbi:MAG: hypothetical protein ACPGXZ_17080, partial [Saprospiraceae bacterium]